MHRSTWTTFSRALARWMTLAMLLAALAPAVSRAMGMHAASGPPAGRAGVDWIEICGPSGLRWVQLGKADAPGDIQETVTAGEAPPLPAPLLHAAAMDQCALCGLSLDRCLPAQDAVTLAFTANPPTGHPPRRGLAPLAWQHARPRATGPPHLL